MRRPLKILHTLGAIGFAGGIAGYLIFLNTGPEVLPTEDFARFRDSLAALSRWLIVPSLAAVMLSGILSMGDSTN